MPDTKVRDGDGGGKWTVGTASGRNAGMIFDEHGEAVAAVYGLPVNWSVSECKSDAESADALRRAYKLAAAPALARELAAATAWMIERQSDEYGPRENWAARERIEAQEAALALAEGEQS